MFRSVQNMVGQDWEAIQSCLKADGIAMDIDSMPRQFEGGLANLNYLVHVDHIQAVFRRPPDGDLPPGAHDMVREHKILSRLSEFYELAPRSIFLCTDENVIGVPFQIIEYRKGDIFRGDSPKELTDNPDKALTASLGLVHAMVSLHDLSIEEVGLEDLGKPDGFVERNVKGWINRAAKVGDDTTACKTVSEWMSHNAPDDSAPSLIHNDIKFDNMIFDPEECKPIALIDWDMGTLGHPLLDLATTLSYWTEAKDPDCLHKLGQMPTAHKGFLERTEVAALYHKLSGRDISDLPFFYILAMFKLGVVFQQLEQRRRARGDQGDNDSLADLGRNIINHTADLTQQSVF